MTRTRIADLRQERGWTQERLAAESGVGLRTVQRMEAGHDASLETLSLLAEALRVPVRDLFAEADDEVAARVGSLEARAAEQQRRRGRVSVAWLLLYLGLGIVALFSAMLGTVGAFVFISYWTGGLLVAIALWRLVLEPRLDARYPLSRSRREIRRAGRDELGSARPPGGRALPNE